MGREFYITTPIYYVNDRPHIGHAYTTIAADVLARYERLRGESVIFLTGTDENSQKSVDAAKTSGENVSEYTEKLAKIWKGTWERLGISNTDFIRTTEDRHKKTVAEVWKRIWDRGDIYKGQYEGLYCTGHEAFLKESELVDGLCPDHKTKPERVQEENYFFRLSKYEKALSDFYKENPGFVAPAKRFEEVKSFVSQGLEDLSISRISREWGIKVPNDPSHSIYVWFDALINYVSAVGIKEWEKHPADVHMIGKDILRFHAVIWPAMLMSAELPLPKRVVANGFFTIDGVKISKSLGNAIDPLELASRYGRDTLGYFLLREIPYGEDGDFSEEKLKERYNGDLANGLGNFAARVLALGEKQGALDVKAVDPEIEGKIKTAQETVARKMVEFRFHEALAAVWELVAAGDGYINEKKPWEEGDHRIALVNLVVLLDNAAGMLAPFLPEAAAKITAAIKSDGTFIRVSRIENLFPRI